MLIYKIRNKRTDQIYIGQTIHTLERRWKGHLNALRQGVDTYLYRSIHKYGLINFEITPIVRCQTIEELNHREILAIRLFKSMAPIGFNMMNGGNQSRVTNEIKQKMSHSMKAFYKINNSFWKGKHLSEETKFKISQKKKIEQQSLGVNNPMYGKTHKKSSIIKNAATNGSKPFYVFTKDGTQYLGEWLVKTQCAKALGISREQVRDALKGRIAVSKGYIFAYKGST